MSSVNTNPFTIFRYVTDAGKIDAIKQYQYVQTYGALLSLLVMDVQPS
jgi:hypothetical protein